MSLEEITVAGTLKSDGTLELDQPPSLAPGRVTVVLRPERSPALPGENWWQFLERSRRELESAGATFMDDAAVNAHIESLRDGDRVDEMLQATPRAGGEPS